MSDFVVTTFRNTRSDNSVKCGCLFENFASKADVIKSIAENTEIRNIFLNVMTRFGNDECYIKKCNQVLDACFYDIDTFDLLSLLMSDYDCGNVAIIRTDDLSYLTMTRSHKTDYLPAFNNKLMINKSVYY